MRNNIISLTGAPTGVFIGSIVGRSSNECYKDLKFNDIDFVNDSIISYDNYNGLFTAKESGVYQFNISLKIQSLYYQNMYIKLEIISLDGYTISSAQNIIDMNLDLTLSIYMDVKKYESFKFRLIPFNNDKLSYIGKAYINYSLNSIK